mmetsp:Transcript_71061/g.169592  ORF Transcript_71061/g.169592 Transcript_71061/m.169592 type:complete len:406 (-) Transcript_71061:34-1251(-)
MANEVPEDPFVTALRAENRRQEGEPPTEPASQVDLGHVKLTEDPFLAAGFSKAGEPNVQRAKESWAPWHDSKQQAEAADHGRDQPWSDGVYTCLGVGDTDRQPRAKTVLLVVPILIFLWEILIWSLLSHVSVNGCWLITITLMVVSATAIGMWYQGIRWGPVSLVALGSLCIIAIVLGTVLGQRGWDHHWRQYWWMNTGQQLVPTVAGTPSGARSDAATLAFGMADGSSLDHSSVDSSRSVGFKDTDLYCAAPILSPSTAGSDFPRVNFWAVGINCCTKSGIFDCDDSRLYDAMSAVVLLEGGFPCPSCNVEAFKKAVAKAESTHGLVSAPDALLVTWVKSVSNSKFYAGLNAVGFLLLDMFLGSCGLYFLGWIAWYYGLGKRTAGVGLSFSAQDAQIAREKRLQ